MRNLRERGAAITGAAGGIGRALALRLAAEGCRVAVSDVDEAGLDETAGLLAAAGARVDRARVDVAEPRAVQAWADGLARDFGPIHLVVNNAGVTLNASIAAMSYEDLDWVMSVNFRGVVHGTKAFLPYLESAGEGCIVNMSSAFGLIAVPTQAAYCASKFAVRGFTEALRQELAVAGSPVTAVCVHPGGVRTALVRSGRRAGDDALGLPHEEVVSGFDRLARLSAERAAETIVKGIKRGRGRILVGADARLIDWAQRLIPSSYQRFVVRRARAARFRSP